MKEKSVEVSDHLSNIVRVDHAAWKQYTHEWQLTTRLENAIYKTKHIKYEEKQCRSVWYLDI